MFFRSEIRLWSAPRQLKGEVIRRQATTGDVCAVCLVGEGTWGRAGPLTWPSLMASPPPWLLPLWVNAQPPCWGTSGNVPKPRWGSEPVHPTWRRTADLPDSHYFPPPGKKAQQFLPPLSQPSWHNAGWVFCSTNGFGNESKRLSGRKSFRAGIPQPGIFSCALPLANVQCILYPNQM